jgi:Type IV secretion system pilin
MFKKNKVETIKVKDFLNGTYKEGGNELSVSTGQEMVLSNWSPLLLLTAPAMVMARQIGETVANIIDPPVVATMGGIGINVAKAFNPIVELAQAIGDPLGFLFLCGGFLVMMTGQRHKGIQIIKWTVIGYIGLQFAPALMGILKEVATAMKPQ